MFLTPSIVLSTPSVSVGSASKSSDAYREDAKIDSLKKASDWHDRLDGSPVLRYTLFFLILVALLLLNFTSIRMDSEDTRRIVVLTSSLYVALLVAFSVLGQKDLLTNRRIVLVWGAILLQLCIIKVIVYVLDLPSYAHNKHLFLLLIPYGIAPMISSVLLGRRIGICAVLGSALFGCILVPKENSVGVLVTTLIAGCVTIMLANHVRSRSQLLRAGCYTGLVVVVMCVLMGNVSFGGWGTASLKAFGLESLLAFLISLLTAIFLGGIFPALESTFGIITPSSWLELADMNHKLLREMQLKTPGTFHHSLAVAQLAETAAEEIGANSVRCRVCAYFHDLGKLKNPDYFIENIGVGAHSPHDELAPSMSAHVIIQHVLDGEKLAREHKLNKHIISVIREHHGTSLVYFFYRKALDIRDSLLEKAEKGLINREDVDQPSPPQYTYPGPIPQSKESGIVSLADIVESAARTLQHPTEDSIRELVDRLIRARVVDGQLNDSNLTLGELSVIRESFVSTLKSMMHSRISYPKEESPASSSPSVKNSSAKEPVKELGKNVVKESEEESDEESNPSDDELTAEDEAALKKAENEELEAESS